jgi:hypothetical protein
MTRRPAARVEVFFTLWAKHEKVNPAWAGFKHGWMPLMTGLHHQMALDEMITRQDRVRRSGQPCQFKVLPDGKQPDERRGRA